MNEVEWQRISYNFNDNSNNLTTNWIINGNILENE